MLFVLMQLVGVCGVCELVVVPLYQEYYYFSSVILLSLLVSDLYYCSVWYLLWVKDLLSIPLPRGCNDKITFWTGEEAK